MSKIEDGGPDAPIVGHSGDYALWMTLRQYYAGQILAGFAGNSGMIRENTHTEAEIVAASIRLADKLIAALKGGAE